MVETSAGGAAASGEESAAAGVDVSREGATVQRFENTAVELTAGSAEASGDDDDVAILTNVQPQANNPNDISPNLDLDEQEEGEGESFDDVEIDGGAVGCLHPSVNGNGIQQRYVEGIQKRLQYEVLKDFGKGSGALSKRKWLLDHLKERH
jgi:hypothetical protein